MRTMEARQDARGFTLLEMLVALFVFSLLAVSATGILNSGLTSQAVLKEREARLGRLAIARALMSSDLGQIAGRTVRHPETGNRFDGLQGGYAVTDGELMTFVRSGWSNPGLREARGNLQLVAYVLEDGILKRRSWARVDVARDTPVSERTIMEGVREVTVSYSNGFDWLDRWPHSARTTGLPRAVALDMEVEGVGPLRQVFLTPGSAP